MVVYNFLNFVSRQNAQLIVLVLSNLLTKMIQKKPHEYSSSENGMDNPLLNPDLEGGDFFWEGGNVGILFLHGLLLARSSESLIE